MRGISLEEIAEATKIGTRSLRALEEQDFDKLPGGIFNKGFVRAYSKYLGIDEEQAVADYVDAVNEAQATGKLSRPDVEPPAVELEAEQSESFRVPWTLLACLLLLAIVGYAGRFYYSKYGLMKLRRQPTPVEAAKPAAPTQVPPETAPAPAPTSFAPPAMPEVASQRTPAPEMKASESAIVVKVHAKELTWVEIEADGKKVISENLPANADRVVKASKQVVIRTGNAGGIEVSENDKLLPSLGPKNEVRTVTLTGQGMDKD